MKKFTVFNSSNPFCFNQNKLFNNCEISNIQINLRAPIGDFVIEFSNNLTNNKDDNVVYYRKQDLNIIGYGVLNGKNIDIHTFGPYGRSNIFYLRLEIEPSSIHGGRRPVIYCC